MHRKIAVVLIACAVIFAAEQSFAEEKPGFFKRITNRVKEMVGAKEPATKKAAVPAVKTPAKKTAVPEKPKEYTRAEMISELKEILTDEEEILNFLPSVKKELDEKGQAVYRFDGVKLEELDDATLKKTFTKVRQEANRIRRERLNAQLENIRRNERLADPADRGAPRIPKVPATPPRTIEPTVPSVPTQVPRVPKSPTPPPVPPDRR